MPSASSLMLIFSSAKSCRKIYVSWVDVCHYLLQFNKRLISDRCHSQPWISLCLLADNEYGVSSLNLLKP